MILWSLKHLRGFDAGGWNENHYILINQSRNTERASWHSYAFTSDYFSGENRDYIPRRIGIDEDLSEDFVSCLAQFVYPVI